MYTVSNMCASGDRPAFFILGAFYNHYVYDKNPLSFSSEKLNGWRKKKSKRLKAKNWAIKAWKIGEREKKLSQI